MTRDDALKLLQNAPRGSQSSRLNPLLSQAQAVDIVIRGIKALPIADNAPLPELFEKRVKQVCQDRKMPR